MARQNARAASAIAARTQPDVYLANRKGASHDRSRYPAAQRETHRKLPGLYGRTPASPGDYGSDELGGAGGIRCQGLSDISAIKGRTEVPVIGIWKEGHEGVYITPTLRHARACVAAGADIVAVDATDRPRPDGKTLEDTVRPLKEEGVLVMADCATIEDIRHAFAIGCDIASTTLSHPGAAIDCGMADGPDVALVRQATTEFPDKPVICEGRVHTPADAKAAMDAGAWAVVVGTAITHPTSITSWFVEAVEG